MAGAKFKDFISCNEKYAPSFKITNKEDAAEYFASCVEHTMRMNSSLTENEAIELEKTNIGYFSGYTDIDSRRRIENLFNCEHPLFGSIDNPITGEVIFKIGKAIGEASRGKEDISITEMKKITKSIISESEKNNQTPKPIMSKSEKKVFKKKEYFNKDSSVISKDISVINGDKIFAEMASSANFLSSKNTLEKLFEENW